MPIGQYRNVPLPIRVLGPIPKRLSLKRILNKGLKPLVEDRADGTFTGKVIQ